MLEPAEEGWGRQRWGAERLVSQRTGWMKEGRDVQSQQMREHVFYEQYMDGHRKNRQENSQIYLLHTTLNGEIPCNLYTSCTRSLFTLSSTEATECTHQSRWEKVWWRVWPLKQGEESVGTVKQQQQQLMGGERCNTHEWDCRYLCTQIPWRMTRVRGHMLTQGKRCK